MIKRKDECFKCTSRKCHFRIVTPDLKFDEISCPTHNRDLEIHADQTLNGDIRMHHSSSGYITRGLPYLIP